MTTVRLTVDPNQTAQEEAELVARLAAAITESTGEDTLAFELQHSEQLRIAGTEVAERLQLSARWSG
ncbi:MAG: hypothetical protein GEU81_16310 [Nitriliruptorales bacterium]|nr:hypothetical protein [Nitriliruptorales bacterium]